MPASTGVDLAARSCCYPGPHSEPSVGWAQGVRGIPKHDVWRAGRVRPLSLQKRLSRYLLRAPMPDSHRRQLGVSGKRHIGNDALAKVLYARLVVTVG
jgi:hypothetical protein